MPSPSDQTPFNSAFKASDREKSFVQKNEADAVDLSQIYVLIDSILPFEACLYYQVLPLLIEGSRLVIGVVNPDDPEAVEYVKKQLSYINYSISFKDISSDQHRDLLSKYLNHTTKQRQQGRENHVAATVKEPARSPSPAASERNMQQTLIVDQPDEIPEFTYQEPPADNHIERTFQLDLPTPAEPVAIAPTTPEPSPPLASTPASAAPTAAPLSLKLDSRYRDVANPQLLSLSPHGLMQALLSKVLEEGIGRLYFERRDDGGRILWSRDGILQAVVEAIDVNVFQGVINELKRLTHLSLISVKKSKQVEIERAYEGQRILLRFRVIPGTYGEEATLQVLRGTALRFYQQQQIDRLGRDALDAAQVLQNRLSEIRDRARNSLHCKPTRSETLPALIELLKQMEAQVEEILSSYDLGDAETTYQQQSLFDDPAARV